MSVDFFTAHHTQSSKTVFGLFDEPDPAKEPAYILEGRESEWIGIVRNPDEKDIHFYGLDDSLIIEKRVSEESRIERESLCDGMIHHDNNLSFVELKSRTGSNWLSKATGQLINTVRLFAKHHTLDNYEDVKAYVCNRLRPMATLNYTNQIQRFKTETAGLNFKGRGIGLEMDVKREIIV